jgi:tetratricopeptide (TPR) repeat protein
LLDGDDGVGQGRLLLRWLVTQLRPDQESTFERIDREAWLNLTSWRPMLAVMCQAGLAPIPEFRDRYRRRADEIAMDNLCGLWGVGASTYYRYLERGKRLMAAIVRDAALTPARTFSLRRMIQLETYAKLGLNSDEQRARWHSRQAERSLREKDVASSLWHDIQCRDSASFVDTLRVRAPDLASNVEVDALVERLAAMPLHERPRVELWLARGVLARTRNAIDRELHCYQQALQVASESTDPLLLGMASGALGKYFESRDSDRAFAYYEDSAEFLRKAAPDLADRGAVGHYLTTLVRLAWLYAIRSDPRSKAVLDRAEELRNRADVPDEVLGILEQTWAEYWRRAGDVAQALEHRHRALITFERLSDQRSILVTYLNLCIDYGQAKDFARAIDYGQRIFAAADARAVEPATLASAHINLGVAYFGQGKHERAIEQYQLALDRCLQADLPMRANLAHYNLAEVYYRRYSSSREPEDERAGDAHVAAVIAAPAAASTPALLKAARSLKSEVLGTASAVSTDGLMPQEAAVHLEEMSEVQRQRAVLAVPMAPQAHARAHLAIANAYLAISTKEREAAQHLIQRHRLGDQFAAELGRLRETFDRNLSREQRCFAQWQNEANDLLDEARRAAVVARLLRDGAINKSAYAELCNVSPATASKHLSTLTTRGLLQQTGKGPSTRYLLKE